MIVRPPKFSELDQVVALGKLMHAEGDFNFVPFEDDFAYFRARNALEKYHDGEGAFIAVAESSDAGIIGFIMGALGPYLFSRRLYAADMAVFVRQDKRGSSAGVRLVQAFESWGKEHNAMETSFGVSTGVNAEKSHGFYTKMGYNHLGGIYKKRNQQEAV